MLSYFLSAAIAAAVGTAGGFLGGRMANTNLRRAQATMLDVIDDQAGEVQKRLAERPTNEALAPFFTYSKSIAEQQQAMAEAMVTRAQLEPVLGEVVTRQELDVALRAVVRGVSQPGAAPAAANQKSNIPPMFQGGVLAAAGAPQEQLSSMLSDMTAQMAQINQQLGIG